MIRMQCSDCGSTEVMVDAWASWDEEKQAWVVDQLFNEARCNECDRSTTINEIEVEYEALMPDGTRCEWDERLRTVGALMVPKEV